ncbi:hypothetical protein N7536_007847 [Penicillium majusculum]|uniref:Uncharacterized protein n=1 Tax=Penicillium solitum TaxID=60172 RepID=A0A1V6QJC8_9EURO|nr:uncharacterized protein PENSOL_c063G00145 [Penicillium solitum]KAJ5685228.1 hypothetical protein N7536_007847 [Penicillium majusculum]OQD89349.1 hypothetical protein PENSOL_c063G00145 [Penicillium solitum]
MIAPLAPGPDPIALVGIGCHMPGGVRDLPALWEFLKEQKDVHREFDEPRFSAKGFSHPNPDRPGTAVVRSGFLLDEDPRLFDAAFFGITDNEVETMDASQRKLLEVTYEAFENAGETWEGVSGSRVGVFVGDISFDNYLSQTRDWDYSGKYSATGAFPNMLANRIHYVFNLKGPSLLVNSACTSAMYALHLAINSIRNGDCESAIVAGSNWIMDPNCHIAMGKLGALSATSRSHTFDASADGYARGEGFAALYLKKTSLAIEDGSPIRALIMGSAINANGRTNGITNPSGPAQEIVIREAYKNAGNLDPSQTTLLECHGTGTRVGDPTEIKAAGNVFGPSRSSERNDHLVVGSVKTNLGHLEGACALPGILKVVAALEQGEIPPTLGFQTPNPRIDFKEAKARVSTHVEPWPKDKLKRASITSAGFGGTNGHCIIDDVHNLLPSYVKPGIVGQHVKRLNGQNDINGKSDANGANGHSNANVLSNGASNPLDQRKHHNPKTDALKLIRKADAGTRKLVVLPFSAHNQTSLVANVDSLSEVIHQHSLADVAYTLSARRSRFMHRAYYIADKDQVPEMGLKQENELEIVSSPQQVSAGFIFTGQGAQWHAMGAGLFQYSVFQNVILYLDSILAMLPEPAPWRIADFIAGNCGTDDIQTPAVSQTVCTAVQIGLVDLLASWSVQPAGVAGHSSGEIAAAYASGRITAAEAIVAAYYRGYMVSFNNKRGAMLAVGFGPKKAMEYIREADVEDRVTVAAINSFDSVTLSGDVDCVEDLSARLSKESIFNRLLRTGGLAYHSHHMLPFGSAYEEHVNDGLRHIRSLGVDTTSSKYPFIPWASSVIPDKSTTEVTASYWRANLESPVRFTDAVSNLLSLPGLNIGALVEIGPHPALKGPLGQIIKSLGKVIPHIASLKRNQDAQRSILDCTGTLFVLNVSVNLVAVNAIDGQGPKGEHYLEYGCTAIDLPRYKYTYGPIKYHESRLSKEYRLRPTPRHDLLGSKVPGTTKLRPQWRNMLRLKDLAWLNDHRVPPHVLHPGAAHIVMAMVAAEHKYNEFPDALPIIGLIMRNVSIKKTLVIPEDDHGIEIVLSMELEDGATAKSPGWASFSIASVVRDSDQWTEHCSGQIKVEVAKFEQAMPIDTTMDGRLVDAQTWYTRFADMGLQFGPSFQGYSDIRADPAKNIASAKLALNTTAGMFPGGESTYPIHPASLDLVIRLGLMACNGGQAETASVQLPIHFNQMKFNYGHLEGLDWATGVSRGELRGLRGAYAQLQMLDEEGKVMLDIDNMRFTSLNNEQESSSTGDRAGKAYFSPFARLVWRPDIRTMSKDQFNEALTSCQDNLGEFPQLCRIFDLAGHANPDLRVLELGVSSNAGATQAVLKVLVGSNSIKRYREYVATDITEEGLESVRESTAEFRDVKYSVLDIKKDPSQQGFQSGLYDIIVCSNGLQTPQAMQHLRRLVSPTGRLIHVNHTGSEITPESLQNADFEIVGEVTEPAHHSIITVHALRSIEQHQIDSSRLVHLLHGDQGPAELLHQLAQALAELGLAIKISSIDDAQTVVSPNSHVVAFLDGDNLLFAAGQHRIGLFQHLAANTASMMWLTSMRFAENPAGQFLSVDIDAEDFRVRDTEMDRLVSSLVEVVLPLQQSPEHNREIVVNHDLAWQDGNMWVSRLVPDTELQGYDETAADDQNIKAVPLSTLGPVRAAFKTPGILTSLYFKPYIELWKALPQDWIEIKLEAYVGVISDIGSSVHGLSIGDRVYGMGKGHFGSYTRVPAVLAQKLEASVASLEAATMPLVYMTAVYAFEHITRVKGGSKVLIQSGSGGLGLAAIQLALSKGADVYVTVGTADKAQFLTDVMGIPSDHIFSSRKLTDVPRMICATKNGGFDVILSTSHGDMLHESIEALAPLGHLIDVGRMDVTGAKTVALELFQKSASFTSFDLGLVIERDVELGGDLMFTVNQHFRAGRIGPIRPYHVSDISQLDQALLKLSKGTHIGKMVISYQNPSSLLSVHQSVTHARFLQEASYILVGGLSPLGRCIIRWMVSRGAQHFSVWSIRGADNLSPEAAALINEMASQGVRIQMVTCDVSNREQVLRSMQDANSERAVRGVFNYAVSYQDISFDKMTADMFYQGMAAKVFGTKNLHEATANLPLDFFTMTSSLGTIYAFPTQSTYLAANNFLDYFARYRRQSGLPATTVSLGFIKDLGALTQDEVTVNLFARTKGQTVTGNQVLRALEPALVKDLNTKDQWLGRSEDPLSAANIFTGVDPAVLANMKRAESKGSASGTVPRWYHDPRVSLMLRAMDDAWRYGNEGGSDKPTFGFDDADESPAVQLRRHFEASMKRIRNGQDEEAVAETVKLVTDAIRTTVAGMLFIDPSVVKENHTVVDHGIDSLLAAEFRTWLNSSFGKNISMLQLMDARSNIGSIAQVIVEEAIGA